jgi:Ser/Thr protein kinase RdoA (MazF antagonist)
LAISTDIWMINVRYILNQYPADCQPTSIEPLGAAGGMSGAVFWRIYAPRGELALRRWPTEHPTPERLRFIHAVVQHAKARGIAFVPVPIGARDGQSFVEQAGHLWELAPWMPGAPNYERSPSGPRLRAAMTALAQIHVAVADASSASDFRLFARPAKWDVPERWNSAARRLARLRDLQAGEMATLERAVNDAHWPGLATLSRKFISLLPQAVPHVIIGLESLAGAALPLQCCLRDIWHDHVLFTGDKVTGIIDFGAVDSDTPATDVARLLGSLVGDDSAGWQAGLDAYAATRPLSEDEIRAVTALDASGTILAGCNWIRWIYVEGREFEDHQRVIDRFARLCARIKSLT